MRLDHLLSKEKSLIKVLLFIFQCTLLKYNNYFKLYIKKEPGDVAQLARAPALQAGGQEFDSPHLHQARININFS